MGVESSFLKLSLNQLTHAAALNECLEKAAQKLFKKYGPVLNHLIDVVFITDTEGHFLLVNKASQARTGISTKLLIGRHFSEIVDPDYREFAQSYFQKVLRGEKTVPAIEIERQTASGEKVTVEINLSILSENDVVVGLMGVARDITDRKLAQETVKKARDELERHVQQRTAALQKANAQLTHQIDERLQAEQKLKESEEKYRGLFENSSDAIFIVDTETGKILDANRQAERLTGRKRQEIIGMDQSRLHPSQDFAYYTRKFQKHIAEKRVFDLEAEVVQKNGNIVPVFINSNLIDLPGKKVIQGIYRDISKEKLISDLKGELKDRKLVNKAKAIIAERYKINDSDALKLLQRESRRQNRKLKDMAQVVISSKFILD